MERHCVQRKIRLTGRYYYSRSPSTCQQITSMLRERRRRRPTMIGALGPGRQDGLLRSGVPLGDSRTSTCFSSILFCA